MFKYFKKIWFSLLFISFFGIVNAQSVDENILYWSKNYRLDFKDFNGRPGVQDTLLQSASARILTHKLGSISTSIDVRLHTEDGKTVFTINAGMKRDVSWIKEPGDAMALKHEQGHFDICEIYARMLRKEIFKAQSLVEAREIYEKISAEEELEQEHFDKENTVQVGGITETWSIQILNRIKELEAFDNATVVLAIDK